VLVTVTGSSAANGLTEEDTWAAAGDSGLLRLSGRWFRHESGALERIAWHLTLSGCHFIVRAILKAHIFREISLIWEIPVKTCGSLQ
jgi:hypothetical protein